MHLGLRRSQVAASSGCNRQSQRVSLDVPKGVMNDQEPENGTASPLDGKQDLRLCSQWVSQKASNTGCTDPCGQGAHRTGAQPGRATQHGPMWFPFRDLAAISPRYQSLLIILKARPLAVRGYIRRLLSSTSG
jgi:hypothetical protein